MSTPHVEKQSYFHILRSMAMIGGSSAINVLFSIVTTKALAVLLEFPAEVGEPLALFAAAELARDEVAAPLIARSLFISYADLVPSSVWAPKALLAAIALAPASEQADELRRRLHTHAGNAYLVAVSGGLVPVQLEPDDCVPSELEAVAVVRRLVLVRRRLGGRLLRRSGSHHVGVWRRLRDARNE